MSNLVEPYEAFQLAERQVEHHTKSVRRLNCPTTDLNDLLEFAQGLRPKDVFTTYYEIRFVYEYLHMGKGVSRVKALVDSWIEAGARARGTDDRSAN